MFKRKRELTHADKMIALYLVEYNRGRFLWSVAKGWRYAYEYRRYGRKVKGLNRLNGKAMGV